MDGPKNSARVMCINPCLPSEVWPPVVLDGVTLPGLGLKIKPSLNLNISGGCDSCEVVASFMAQIQPLLIALQLPMCLLTCASKVKDVLTDLADVLSHLPNPDVAQILTDIALATTECAKCITGWSPGKICAMLRDILDIVVSVLKCIIGILEKLVTLNLQVSGMMLDPEVSISQTGECLYGLLCTQQEHLGVRLDAIGALLTALGFLFSFAGVSLPTSITADLSSVSRHTPLASAIELLQNVVRDIGEPNAERVDGTPREQLAYCASHVP